MKPFPFGGAKRYFPAVITREVVAGTTVVERTDGAAPEPDASQEIYRITGSSEYIVERNWYGMVWRERLLHGKANVQMGRFASGNAPLLVDHDTSDQVGVLVNSALRNGVTDCEAKFSRSQRAQEVRQDVDDLIRSSTSIGYIPKRAKLVEENETLGDLWDVTLWEPLELSLVPCPADPTVGVQRSMRDGSGGGFPPVEVEEGERSMNRKVVYDVTTRALLEVDASDTREAATLEQIRAAGGTTPPVAPRVEVGNDRAAKREEEIIEIHAMAKRYNVDLDIEWIRAGLTPDAVGRKMADALMTRGVGQPAAEALAKAGRDAGRYSIQRAIQQQLRWKETGSTPDGLEGEISREIAKNLPQNYGARGGIFVPLGAASAKRSLDSLTGGAGAELVVQQRGPFIEQLRATSILSGLGAQFLTGIKGTLAFTKKTGNATVKWRAENPGTPTPKTQLSLALVLADPKTMCGNTSYSRQLAMLASDDVGAMIDTDLVDGHSLALDLAGFHGNGVNEPLGLYSLMPDVQIQAMGGPPTYQKLIKMLGKVADKNASRGKLGWATTALMAAEMRSTLEASAAGARWIWQGVLENGDMAGYKAIYSTQLSKVLGAGAEHALIFGNWNDMIVCMWDAMELLVDPYTEADEAMVRVLSFQMGDIVVRHGESFCKATGATISA